MCIIFLIFTLLISFSLLWCSKIPIALFGDNLIQNLPIFYEVFKQWRDGHIPLYNPYIFGGQSLIGNPLSGVFYPPYWIGFFFLKNEWILDFSLLFHIFVSVITSYLLLKFYKFEKWSRIIGALTYGMSGIMILLGTGCTQMHAAAAWFPLIILGFEKLLLTPSFRNSLFLSLITLIEFLTCYIQYFVYILFFIIIIFLTKLFKNKIKKKQLKFIFISFFLSFTFIFPFLIPKIIFMKLTTRSLKIGFNSGLDYNFFINPFLFPKQILGFIIPEIKVPWFSKNFEYSSTPLFLGIICWIGIIFSYKSGKKNLFWIYLITFIVSIFFSLGPDFFWQHILYHIPIYNLFRSPIKILVFTAFSSAILCSLGIEYLIKKYNRKIFYVILILFIFDLSFKLIKTKEFIFSFNESYSFYNIKYKAMKKVNNLNIKTIKKERILTLLGNNKNFIKIHKIPFNFPDLFEIPALHGYGPTLPNFLKLILNMDNRGIIVYPNNIKHSLWFLNLINVNKLLVTNDLTYLKKDIKLSLNHNFIFFPEKLYPYKNINQVIKFFQNNSSLVKKIAFINKTSIKKIQNGKILEIKWLKKSPHKIRVKMKVKKTSFAVLSIPYDDCWIIKIDNKYKKTVLVNGFLLGFFIENDGKPVKKIVLTYNPWKSIYKNFLLEKFK